MLVVLVQAQVKPDCVDSFRQATAENARASLQEPGVARFDVIQQVDDPSRFILIEVYRHTEATLRHKETAHYQKWRDTVAPMMAAPRASIKYVNVYPEDGAWGHEV